MNCRQAVNEPPVRCRNVLDAAPATNQDQRQIAESRHHERQAADSNQLPGFDHLLAPPKLGPGEVWPRIACRPPRR